MGNCACVSAKNRLIINEIPTIQEKSNKPMNEDIEERNYQINLLPEIKMINVIEKSENSIPKEEEAKKDSVNVSVSLHGDSLHNSQAKKEEDLKKSQSSKKDEKEAKINCDFLSV